MLKSRCGKYTGSSSNPTGRLVVGFVDRESFLGRVYEKQKRTSVFYSVANSYSTDEVLEQLKAVGFSKFEIKQTIFHDPRKMRSVEVMKNGHGEGAFVVLAASKNRKSIGDLAKAFIEVDTIISQSKFTGNHRFAGGYPVFSECNLCVLSSSTWIVA
jgi:hypothetical protein